jgi:SAM-dependent methyltransferase
VGGSQLPVKDRVNSWDVKEYKIADLKKPHECKQKPDYIIDLNRCPHCENKSKLKPKIWDIVFCLEVMEYIHNPWWAIKNCRALLKKGGILYITFPTFYPIHNPLGEDCLRYTVFGIEKLFNDHNLEIVDREIRRLDLAAYDHLQACWAIDKMRPSKELEFEEHLASGYIYKAKKI